MPLPKDPFTVNGGCNCRAIRYRIDVPAFAERPASVYCTPNADIGDAKIPFVAIDHCNDCRRATSSIVPMVLVADATTGSISFDSNPWEPASILWTETATLKQQHPLLGHYSSSVGRNRWFCPNCGTPFAYTISDGIIPADWGWPRMLDTWLGTVDREDLEKHDMRPERMLWCQRGVPWIREFTRNGAGGVPEHPLTKIDKVEGDDISEDLLALQKVGKI